MKKINILFLAPHWSVDLIKAFGQARERAGVEGVLAGADSKPYSSTLRILQPSYVIPRFDEPACREAVLEICRRDAIHAVIPLSNKAVEFLDAHRGDFQSADVRLFLPEAEAVATCLDKKKLGAFFVAHDIPSPAAFCLDALPKDPRFPLFAKRRRGEGGNDSFLVEGPGDLEFYARKYPDHVFQEYIGGREYSIDLFVARNGEPLLIVPRERLEVRNGEVWVSRIHMDPGLITAARGLSSRLGLRGPCNVQGIFDGAGRFYFTDVNPRFGSGAVHTIAAGGDIPLMIYKELAGEPTATGPVQDGSVMTRFHDSYLVPAAAPSLQNKKSNLY